MLAAVTTTSALLVVDLLTHEVVSVEQERPEYYGLSWFPGDPALVLTHSHLDNESLVDLVTYARSETGIVSHGDVISPPFLSQPHQILCASDGRVVCTNTGRNCITAVDLSRPGVFQEVRWSDQRWDRLGESDPLGDHLNSIYEREGVLYALAHRHHRGSYVATLSYPELELLTIMPAEGRTGLHNVWQTDEGWTVSCDSNHGRVVDLANGTVLWDCGRVGAYTRGLAATSDVVVVGESQSTGRRDRRSSTSALWMLDRSRWRALDYFELGPYGAVNDVRLLDVADDAHHNSAFAGAERFRPSVVRERIVGERIALSHSVNLVEWQTLGMVLGRGRLGPDRSRSADSDEVCLAISKELHRQPVEFNYSIDSDEGHVAYVVGYTGGGADRNMIALILQATASEAHVSRFRHDGLVWNNDRTIKVSAEADARKGRMGLRWTDTHANVVINGVVVEALERTLIPYGATGVRWSGATVRPLPTDVMTEPPSQRKNGDRLRA